MIPGRAGHVHGLTAHATWYRVFRSLAETVKTRVHVRPSAHWLPHAHRGKGAGVGLAPLLPSLCDFWGWGFLYFFLLFFYQAVENLHSWLLLMDFFFFFGWGKADIFVAEGDVHFVSVWKGKHMPRTAESGDVMPFIKPKEKACCDIMTVTCNFFIRKKEILPNVLYCRKCTNTNNMFLYARKSCALCQSSSNFG